MGIVACTLSSMVLSGDYDKDNHWPTKKKMQKTSRPTKWSPPSYEKEREWMKNWEKPTADMIDEPTYEKEPAYLSWGQNPYNNRERRSQMKAQLKEQIESDKQELAALDALEIDVSEEQDEETEGVKETAFGHVSGALCQRDYIWSEYKFCPSHMCCENGNCVHKKKDWIGAYYCPSECRGGPWKGHGTC